MRIVAFSSLTGRKIDIELAQEILKELVDKTEKIITIADVQQIVADYYSLKVSDLKSKNRNKSVVYAPPGCHVSGPNFDQLLSA